MDNKRKLLVFDVDGTLAPHGEPMGREAAAALCELERRGHTIAFASGKTVEYLDGLARGMGLVNRSLIAENGSVIYDGGQFHTMAERPEFFDRLENEIRRLFPGVRMQHNMVNLTALATGDTLKAVVDHLKAAGAFEGSGCRHYLHCDSVELMPRGVDKGQALQTLKQLTGCAAGVVIAAGNGINDEPMRNQAALFLAVGEEIKADLHFCDAESLADYLLRTVDSLVCPSSSADTAC